MACSLHQKGKAVVPNGLPDVVAREDGAAAQRARTSLSADAQPMGAVNVGPVEGDANIDKTRLSFAKLLNIAESAENFGKDEANASTKKFGRTQKEDILGLQRPRASIAKPKFSKAAPAPAQPVQQKRAADYTAGGVKKLKLTQEEHYRILQAKDNGVHRYGNPDGKNPAMKPDCDACGIRKHTTAWEYRANTIARVTTGGICYCCVRACAILKITRSVHTLRAAGLIEKVVEQSNLVREHLRAQGRDHCAF